MRRAPSRERERLFQLPRSTWDDYSTRRDLQGRRHLSRAAPRACTCRARRRRCSSCPRDVDAERGHQGHPANRRVDLLWNGGIGTYVKASGESHADVGDRSNDAVRVDGRELRCKVVGEGGNLGFSQLGRIEYARRGGRLNTDFIDNSAGVNCSDVEVNLKILLNGAVRAGELTRAGARPAARRR